MGRKYHTQSLWEKSPPSLQLPGGRPHCRVLVGLALPSLSPLSSFIILFFWRKPAGRPTCKSVGMFPSSKCSHPAPLPSLSRQQNTRLMCFPVETHEFSAPRPFRSSLVSPLQRKRRPNCPCWDVYPTPLSCSLHLPPNPTHWQRRNRDCPSLCEAGSSQSPL